MKRARACHELSYMGSNYPQFVAQMKWVPARKGVLDIRSRIWETRWIAKGVRQ